MSKYWLEAERRWGEEVQANCEYCVQLGGFLPLLLNCEGGGRKFFVKLEICQWGDDMVK